MTKPPAPAPLGQLSRSELEFLRKAIAKRQLPTPLSELGLSATGKGNLFPRLGPLDGANQEVALALLDLALALRDAGEPGAAKPGAALVWTGPDVKPSTSRATTAVLLELLASAQQRVVLAGYEFDHGAVIFGPLHKAMVERGVKASIYLDVRAAPSPRTAMDAYLALRTAHFLKRNWPFGDPVPELYYLQAGCEYGSRCSLHAKCVVVDGRHVLVGSANFTRRGHMRNVEVGVRLDDAALAAALIHQFDRLVATGKMAALPVVASRRERPPGAAEDEAELDGVVSVAPASDLEPLADDLLVSAAGRPLFLRLVGSGAPVPDVGEDVEGDGGEVLGSPEFSWDEAKVAVLLPEQEGSRKKLEAAGWRCFAAAAGDDEIVAILELVRGEEA